MNKFNADQIATLTNAEITDELHVLNALILSAACGIDYGHPETFEEHETHIPAAKALNDWAQDILGTDFHFSISYQAEENEGMFRIVIREGAVLSPEVDEKVKQFSELIFATGEDFMTFYWVKNSTLKSKQRTCMRRYLTLGNGRPAQISAEQSIAMGNFYPLFEESIPGDVAWKIFRESHQEA